MIDMSSAYHPQSQGALERFHQTLKNILHVYCLNKQKDWDQGIPFLLFAARDAVQESLGFSPFELIFGHAVRGPLKLLKEKWLSISGENDENLLDYVCKFKERLTQAWNIARQNLKGSQGRMKVWYDRHAKTRSFESGDKVLMLLPIPGQPLHARYFGPYEIETKVSELNYIVKTPGRRKNKQLCHINMLKEYNDRNETADSERHSVVSCSTTIKQLEDHGSDTPLRNLIDQSDPKLHNSDVLADLDLKLAHLNKKEKNEIKNLIQEFAHLFPNVPKRTDFIYHDVDVGDANPIKQHPYRMNPLKQKHCQTEIDYMLENDIIEPSSSPWSSPCLLVPKPDGSFRFCTDFRKVNSITKTDSYPLPRIEDCIDKVVVMQDICKQIRPP